MPLKTYRPLTKTLRYKQTPDFAELTTDKPYKALTEGLNEKAGRNNRGIITMRRRGAGHKRRYRLIDFRRERTGVTAVVETIEYDPNRSARIALIRYVDGERRYIIAPDGLKVGATLVSKAEAALEPGNVVLLSSLPLNTFVHNIELRPGKGAQLARAAGTQAEIVAREGDYAQLRIGYAHFRQMLAPQRDQTETREAIHEFETFISRYPDSKLMPEALKYLREAKDRLAQSEFEVGRFYARLNWCPAVQCPGTTRPMCMLMLMCDV